MWVLPWEHDKVFLHKCKEDRKLMVPTKQLWLLLDVIISLARSQASEDGSVSQTNKPQGLMSTHGKWLIWSGTFWSLSLWAKLFGFSSLSVSFAEADTGSQPPSLLHHWKFQNRTPDHLVSANPRRCTVLCNWLLSPSNPCCACRAVQTPLCWPVASQDASSKLTGSSNPCRANHQSIYQASWVGFASGRVLCSPRHASPTPWAA